jgi:hypothetical protein
MEDDANNSNNIVINWNNIVGQEARSIDNSNLGKIQGLFEPFIVTERGTINKEKFYIPKSLIESYNEEILYFDVKEQEAKEYCMRTMPPSEHEAKGIVQILTERRSPVESRQQEDSGKKEGATAGTQIVSVEEEIQRRKKKTHKVALSNALSKVDFNEEEIANKIKTAANEFKNLVISGTKLAKQKIKQTQEILEEKQASRDAEKISKMGNLANQFTSSFDDILSNIKTRTYEEQEEIYTGFIKLIEQQRDLVVARRDLAAKLKDSVHLSAATTKKPLLTGKKQQQQLGLVKEPELPSPQDPQLPEMIAATTSAAEDELNEEPQIITAAKREFPEQIINKESSAWSRTTATAMTEGRTHTQKINPSSVTKKTKSSSSTSKTKSSRIKRQ